MVVSNVWVWSDCYQYKDRNSRNVSVSSGLAGAANSLSAHVCRENSSLARPFFVHRAARVSVTVKMIPKVSRLSHTGTHLCQPRAPAQGGWHSDGPALSLDGSGSSALVFQRAVPLGCSTQALRRGTASGSAGLGQSGGPWVGARFQPSQHILSW